MFSCLFLQEFFQGLETHVVLTQAFFRQVSGLVVQREVQSLEETVAQAQAVLKQAHKRGVELEGILEVCVDLCFFICIQDANYNHRVQCM